MKSNIKALLAAAGVAAFALSPANAYEGGIQFQTKPGVYIGASAGVPPPGIYAFDQTFSYQSNLAGPVTNITGNKNGVQVAATYPGVIFVPGWTFLGATYDAVVVQPFVQVGIGQPLSLQSATNPFPLDGFSGVHNTFIAPIELSWKLGNGFFVKSGFGVHLPDGTVQGGTGTNFGGVCVTQVGCNGFANIGARYWTFQPELIVSYLGGGYNLSAALYAEFNTANQADNYTQGDIFHADFTATKTFGKWTIGPVAYYVAQVSNDKCPIGLCTALHPLGVGGNAQRYENFAIGGLVEYNFGPASLSVWATQDVLAKASGGAFNNPLAGGAVVDPSATTKGLTVLATISFRLWAPEEPTKAPLLHK
jgi:hypothetical protein